MNWQEMVTKLEKCGVVFEAGLSDSEIEAVQNRFAFKFPPDLRAFLQTALPIDYFPLDEDVKEGKRKFPDWRNGDKEELLQKLQAPPLEVLESVENFGFWVKQWGRRPDDPVQARQLVEGFLKAAPTLIPVYSHRVISDTPHRNGNPVFSIVQANNILCYGSDLKRYLHNEFLNPNDFKKTRRPRSIPFWDINAFNNGDWGEGEEAPHPGIEAALKRTEEGKSAREAAYLKLIQAIYRNIAGIALIVFVTLKLVDYINWSWFWVLAPIWGAVPAAVIVLPLSKWIARKTWKP